MAAMPQKAEDFFPEGCLVCLTHDDMGKERQSVKDQASSKSKVREKAMFGEGRSCFLLSAIFV